MNNQIYEDFYKNVDKDTRRFVLKPEESIRISAFKAKCNKKISALRYSSIKATFIGTGIAAGIGIILVSSLVGIPNNALTEVFKTIGLGATVIGGLGIFKGGVAVKQTYQTMLKDKARYQSLVQAINEEERLKREARLNSVPYDIEKEEEKGYAKVLALPGKSS